MNTRVSVSGGAHLPSPMFDIPGKPSRPVCQPSIDTLFKSEGAREKKKKKKKVRVPQRVDACSRAAAFVSTGKLTTVRRQTSPVGARRKQGPLHKHHGKQSKVIENSDIEDVPAEALALFLLDGRHAVTRV